MQNKDVVLRGHLDTISSGISLLGYYHLTFVTKLKPFLFPPLNSWPLAFLGKFIPVPATPLSSIFKRMSCCFKGRSRQSNTQSKDPKMPSSPNDLILQCDLLNLWVYAYLPSSRLNKVQGSPISVNWTTLFVDILSFLAHTGWQRFAQDRNTLSLLRKLKIENSNFLFWWYCW